MTGTLTPNSLPIATLGPHFNVEGFDVQGSLGAAGAHGRQQTLFEAPYIALNQKDKNAIANDAAEDTGQALAACKPAPRMQTLRLCCSP